MLGGLREIRSRQNIPPKTQIEFMVKCDAETTALLKPMEPYFESMAGAKATAWGTDTAAPELSSGASLPGIELFVDLADHIDVDAEIARNEKELKNLEGMITGKDKKLSNANFVDRAPAEVVEKERASLKQLQEQRASVQHTLERLRSR